MGTTWFEDTINLTYEFNLVDFICVASSCLCNFSFLLTGTLSRCCLSVFFGSRNSLHLVLVHLVNQPGLCRLPRRTDTTIFYVGMCQEKGTQNLKN